MLFARILGWILTLGALAIGAAELYAWRGEGDYHIVAFGELWYGISPGSLNLVQAGVQRHFNPALWDDALRPILLLPAWAVLGVPGVLLLLLVRRRARRLRQPSGLS